MAEVDRGMDVGELRKLLNKSKSEPVNAAFGMDGKNAVILLDKIKQPKAVSKQLEDKYKGLKNVRWGTAFVDTDADPKLVVLTVNRASAGAGRLLKKTLKGTGISKVRIQLEDGSIAEDVGEEDEEGAQAEAAAPAAPEGEPAAAAAAPSEPEPAAAAPAAQPAAEIEVAALTKRLGELVKKLPQFPDRASELKQLATAAGAAIKAGDPAATEQLDALEQQMGGGAASAAAASGAASGVSESALQKSSQIWVATRKKIEDEIAKLHTAMAKHYEGHGFSTDLATVFQKKVEPILTSLDQDLSKKLDEAVENKDPAQRTKLLGEARQLIDQYDGFISSDPLLSQLDNNPFVPLALVKTAQGSLAVLKKSVPAA